MPIEDQSINLATHHQSNNMMPILDKSDNPSPIRLIYNPILDQSLTDPPGHYQSANPKSILGKSGNLMQILDLIPDPMPIIDKSYCVMPILEQSISP